MGEALFKEAWRARASWAAKTIGPVLLCFGQMAVGLPSGGEGVATALQLYCDSPALESRAIVIALDYSNAYSTSLLDSSARATLKLIEWVKQLDDATRTRFAIKDADEVVRAAEAALDDLAFLRAHHGEVLTVVNGSLDRFVVRLGFTQGGLFSMLSFCIAVCFLVLKPLKEKYPEVAPKCIADDAHAPTVIHEPADIERAAQWCTEYVELSEQELNLSANARKFKILQSRKWQGTELDVARFIKLFPSQMHEGTLKRPTVVRDALRVNGVGVAYVFFSF